LFVVNSIILKKINEALMIAVPICAFKNPDKPQPKGHHKSCYATVKIRQPQRHGGHRDLEA
jgi:hypothetical protein